MAEQDKNELVWAKNRSNNIPKQMTRKKLERYLQLNNGWEQCDAPDAGAHTGIVAVDYSDQQKTAGTAPEATAGSAASTTRAPRGSEQEKGNA